ncbi:MAG: Ku protein [Actinobacteria bacterium]|nr:Ku protein [Actinomycetota bacterium]MCL5069863.1 Ku protein [Actinomycetota bacterium]
MKPLWEGTISFGLILIPVKLYKATDERKPDFHLVREKDLCPVKYMRVCKSSGEEVPFGDIAKSYEYQKGDYVILHDEDFRKAYARRSENIEIVEFTDENEIDSKYFEQPYYLEPEKGASKVYALLREALKRTKKAGVAKYVLHNLQHLGILKADGDLLILNQIRFDSELRKPEGLNIPTKEKMPQKEIEMAIMLIDKLSSPFKPGDFKDTFSEEIKKIIEQKVKTGKISSIEQAQPEKPAEVINLMEKLKSSLEKAKKRNVS